MGALPRATRVLVIDDSQLVAAILQEDLTEVGHEVRAAFDGSLGLAMVAQWSPDVVLCDLQMPGLSGFEVVAELKRNNPLTPVLIFTETADLKSAVEAMQRGAWGYLVKGLSAEALNGELLKAIAHRRIMERNHELEIANLRYQQDLEQMVEAKTREVVKLEAARAQADRLAAMGSFVAGIAHEVNNPLAVIKANTAFLVSELPSSMVDAELAREASSALTEIHTCVARIQHIVAGLSRSTGEGITAELCELAPAFEEVKLICRERLPAGLTLTWDVDPAVSNMAMPRNDLVLIVSNLIINAAHAVEPLGKAGEVTVRVWREMSWAKTEVRDNGQGISPENMARIFDPFFTTKPPGKGSGLGLSLVRQVVRNAGGTVTATSEPGAGARFLVSVPVELGMTPSQVPLARR